MMNFVIYALHIVVVTILKRIALRLSGRVADWERWEMRTEF
jgi:hypothetical protein